MSAFIDATVILRERPSLKAFQLTIRQKLIKFFVTTGQHAAGNAWFYNERKPIAEPRGWNRH
jgi:hypothetical protein